jgi:hypothetical protein
MELSNTCETVHQIPIIMLRSLRIIKSPLVVDTILSGVISFFSLFISFLSVIPHWL